MRGHKMLVVLATVLLVVNSRVQAGVEDKCMDQSMVKVLEAHLVTEDPFKHLEGTFSRVWIRRAAKEISISSTNEYIKHEDGVIEEKLKYRDLSGKEQFANSQTLKKTARIGVFSTIATHKAPDKTINYYGDVYYFYADHNILGYYKCMKGGPHWSLVIEVKSDRKIKLREDNNEVKQSLKLAEGKMDDILLDYLKKSPNSHMVQYDVNTMK